MLLSVGHYMSLTQIAIKQNDGGEIWGRDGFSLFLKEGNIDVKKLYFASEIRGIYVDLAQLIMRLIKQYMSSEMKRY